METDYTSPQIEVIEIELEDTLCASVEDTKNKGSYGDFSWK